MSVRGTGTIEVGGGGQAYGTTGQTTGKTGNTDTNFKPVSDSGTFYYLSFKKGLGGSSNVEASAVGSKTVKSLSTATPNETTALNSTTAVNASNSINNKIEINSMSDQSAIANVLIGKVSDQDSFDASGGNSLTSHRKPGDMTCLQVLSDLINVAKGDTNNSKVFTRDDLIKLLSTFSDETALNAFKAMPAGDAAGMKAALEAIQKGVNEAIDNKGEGYSKSQCKSMENVMSSSLQRMAGIGRLSYKNKTIYGRREILSTIGKVLKYIGLALGVAALVAGIAMSGGTLLAIGGAAIALKIAAGSAAAVGLAIYLGGANAKINSGDGNIDANVDISFKARLMCNLSSVASFVACVGDIARFILNKIGVEVKFINKIFDKLDIFSKAIVSFDRISSKVESLISMIKNNFGNSSLKIDFKSILDAMQNGEPSDIIAKIQNCFSKIIENMTPEKMGDSLDKNI